MDEPQQNGFSLVDFEKQFRALVEENKKLRNLKERSIEIAQKLDTLAKSAETIGLEVSKIATEIDPVRSLSKKRSPQRSLKDITQVFYQKMKEGVQVTIGLVESTYPDLQKFQCYGVLLNLQKLPGVEKAKDGAKVRLFWHERP